MMQHLLSDYASSCVGYVSLLYCPVYQSLQVIMDVLAECRKVRSMFVSFRVNPTWPPGNAVLLDVALVQHLRYLCVLEVS